MHAMRTIATDGAAWSVCLHRTATSVESCKNG